MSLELESEKYTGLVLDKANELDFQPIFIDAIASDLANGHAIEENEFIKGYFVRVALDFINESNSALKSHRPEIVEQAKESFIHLNNEDLATLDSYSRGVMIVNVGLMPGDGKPKRVHMEALEFVKNDISTQKQRFEKDNFNDLVNHLYSTHFKGIVDQKKKVLLLSRQSSVKYNLKTGQPINYKPKARSFKKKKR